jgi:hypothetical protein
LPAGVQRPGCSDATPHSGTVSFHVKQNAVACNALHHHLSRRCKGDGMEALNGNAVRVARCRQRQRNGLRVFPIEADEVLLVERLIEVGLLSQDQRDDQEAISVAASKYLAAALTE